jgi:hypothetical protein
MPDQPSLGTAVGATQRKRTTGAALLLEHAEITQGKVLAAALRGATRGTEAALVAYDDAFTVQPKHGLPSTAAIEAYLAVSPEPESKVRPKLEAALVLRRDHAVGLLH